MTNKKIQAEAVVFDLDGTLLDTLDDLATSVNFALTQHGLPARPVSEIRAFLGNGIRYLMRHAVGGRLSEAEDEAAFQTFRSHYVDHCLDKTKPYPGIMALLENLKAKGIKMAIVSNKLDPAVKELAARFFTGYVTSAVGERPGVRRKPCPDAVLAALDELGVKPTRAIYVGDSEVDIETAQAAGLPCALVLWGFRDEPFLRQLPGAETFIRRPEELLDVID